MILKRQRMSLKQQPLKLRQHMKLKLRQLMKLKLKQQLNLKQRPMILKQHQLVRLIMNRLVTKATRLLP
jgi:hypothetical protein